MLAAHTYADAPTHTTANPIFVIHPTARAPTLTHTIAQDLKEQPLTKEQAELIGKGCALPPVNLDSTFLTKEQVVLYIATIVTPEQDFLYFAKSSLCLSAYVVAFLPNHKNLASLCAFCCAQPSCMQ